jgi:hypothetical protein
MSKIINLRKFVLLVFTITPPLHYSNAPVGKPFSENAVNKSELVPFSDKLA